MGLNDLYGNGSWGTGPCRNGLWGNDSSRNSLTGKVKMKEWTDTEMPKYRMASI